jgi:hypothetical protein
VEATYLYSLDLSSAFQNAVMYRVAFIILFTNLRYARAQLIAKSSFNPCRKKKRVEFNEKDKSCA